MAWTIVNRQDKSANFSGPAIILPVNASPAWHYYDLYHGVELHPANGSLALTVEAAGWVCPRGASGLG